MTIVLNHTIVPARDQVAAGSSPTSSAFPSLAKAATLQPFG